MQTAAIKAERKGCQSDTDMTSEAYKFKFTMESKSIVGPQMVVPADLNSIVQPLP